MEHAPHPAAGWYPDPQGGPVPSERWWDGTSWSTTTRAVAQGQGAAWGQAAGVHAPRPSSHLDLATGTTSDERTWALLAHLSALVGAFLGPLIVYLVKRDESPFVRAHAAAALNFHLSWTLWTLTIVVVGGILSVLTFGLGLFVLFPALMVIAVGSVVFLVLATIKAGRGEAPTASMYPLSITFVR